MRSFGKGPRPFPSGGSLARAVAACLVMEGQLEADTPAAANLPHSASTTSHPSPTTPVPEVQRGGFGNVALSATELNEAIAAGIFVCLIGTVFWWESRPPRPKRRAGS